MSYLEFQEELDRLAEATMTVSQAAQYLGITTRAVNHLIERKWLSKQVFKNQVLVSVASVEGYKRWKKARNGNMGFITSKNLYTGVNPHLMSLYQTPAWGDYSSFHTDFIGDIKRFISRLLPPGYRARNQDTLSILRQIPLDDLPSQKRFPDVSIRQQLIQPPVNRPVGLSGTAATPDFHVPFPTPVLDTTPLATVIYQIDPGEVRRRGRPVTIIELLSPGNKVSDGVQEYKKKRFQILQAGIALVEIDLLHETPSPVWQIPRYPDEPESTPYYLAVSDPRTSEQTDVYRFSVMQPIPAIVIPLLQGEQIICNFDEIFQYTYEQNHVGADVDYDAEPLRINTYSPADQQRIREHMQQLADNRHTYLPHENT